MRFLLDTNALSEPLKPRPDPGVMRGLRAHGEDLATAAPVWHELLFGLERLPDSGKRRVLDAYLHDTVLRTIPILPYDEPAARWHSLERARLAAQGRTPGFVDGQIAAIAAVHGFVLVTANTRDFAGFEGLSIADWRRGS